MKTILLFMSIIFTVPVFSQNKPKAAEVFGKLQGDSFIIVGDSTKLKVQVMHLIFANRKVKPKLSVQIGKGQTFGETKEDYYYVLLQDKKKNTTVAKWLEKKGNDLILINEYSNENYWQVLTTACIGKGDCMPQVAIVDSTKEWVCGHKLICTSAKTCLKISGIVTD